MVNGSEFIRQHLLKGVNMVQMDAYCHHFIIIKGRKNGNNYEGISKCSSSVGKKNYFKNIYAMFSVDEFDVVTPAGIKI